jgi:hypothetical protein
MNNMTKVYETHEQFMADVVDGVFSYNGNIELRFSLVAPDVSIKAWNINAGDIKARNIKAGDIKAWNINAGDINAGDIKAGDINAGDIKAGDIKAMDIKAWNINYYAVCFAYQSIKCRSIKGRRENAKHFVLDGEVELRERDKTE